MITSEQVQQLNKRIEELNSQRTKAVGRLEVLTNNLNKSLEQYSKLYGVDCRGSTLKQTAAKIKAEMERVEATIQEEYDIRMKVVSAIESGDIDEANRLLGIVVEEDPEDAEEVEEVVLDGSDYDDDEGSDEVGEFDFDIPDDDSDEDGSESDDADDFDFNLDDDDFSIDEEPAEEPPTPAAKKPTAGKKPVSNTGKKSGKKLDVNAGSSVSETVESLEGGEFADIVPSDDDDDDDFGFGELLSGTQFTL